MPPTVFFQDSYISAYPPHSVAGPENLSVLAPVSNMCQNMCMYVIQEVSRGKKNDKAKTKKSKVGARESFLIISFPNHF